jgi:hypothetical protein
MMEYWNDIPVSFLFTKFQYSTIPTFHCFTAQGI